MGNGAEHKGEDGRFVENLIKNLLVKYLPKELEVLTGFILRPAVKTGKDGKSRIIESDSHSTQLDIIVYNSAKYPIFLRSNDTVIVPPEGVISIISVKKTLYDANVVDELEALRDASKLCRSTNLRPPFLALVSMDNKINKKDPDTFDWIFSQIKTLYENDDDLGFDNMVGYIGSFTQWSIFKKRPSKKKPREAQYILFQHKQEEETHLGLQFLLTGILSVYYDKSRTSIERPGFTSFQSGREFDRSLGSIVSKLPAVIAD